MNKSKKRGLILIVICLVILVGAFIADRYFGKEYFVEIKYDKVIEKIENKEDFVLLLSQTTCSHCADYKPKLREISNKYKLTVYYLEVDLLKEKEEVELKKHFNYSSTPVTIFAKEGYEATAATRIVGDVAEEKIIKKLKSNGFID